MEVQIIAIRKDNGNHTNPHIAISSYKWQKTDGTTGSSPRPDTVAWCKRSGNAAYVKGARCEVRSNGHIEFLQTVANGTYTDNLLSLPEY